ncbi:MAG: hypothetical protein JW866_09840 [Ignavibacteriales bacterium]|nr:hypothetical protein [Ignavibacteriales bacterium]
MNIYTYTDKKQNFEYLFEQAKKEGKLLIKRKDGTLFELKLLPSPLDVKGLNLKITKEEIIEFIDESRKK